MRISDWSSDVCSSDLRPVGRGNFLLRRESSRLFAQGHSDGSRQRGAGDGGSGACGDADDLVDRAQDQTRPRRHGSGREIFLTSCRPGARERSEEHTSELQSLMRISYAVFCLKKTKKTTSELQQSHTNRSI